MKRRLAYFGLILLSYIGQSLSINAQEGRAIVPTRPGDLLSCMPPATPEWKMISSNGAILRVSWPMSKSSREFEQILPPAPPMAPGSSVKPVVPVKVKVTILDSGNFEGLAEYFHQSDSSTESTTKLERFTIGSYPAVRKKTPGESERVDILVANRFQVTVDVKGATPNVGLTQEKPEKWFEKMNLSKLISIGQANQTKVDLARGYEFMMERVDEMNPKRSYRTKQYVGVDVVDE